MTTQKKHALAQGGERRMLLFLSAAFALSYLDRQVLSITLSDIGEEFALSDLQLGALSGIAFALIYVVLGFPIAKLSRPGRRKAIVTSAIGVWSVATLLTAGASGYLGLFLARVGVGIGEAGCVPPSHAMIADAFPKERRAGALAFFSAGTNVGVFLAFLIGGVVAATYGWRMAFLVAGAPGLLLAVAMLIWFKEPAAPDVAPTGEKRSYRALVLRLYADKSTRHAILGAALTATVGYGAFAWIATFFIRSHGLSSAQTGLFLACAIGVLGGVGVYASGVIADRLTARDERAGLRFVAISIIIAKPFAVGFYLTENTTLALAVFLVPATIGAAYVGPTFSHVYSRIPPKDRPLAAALMMLTLNLVGLGLGPVIVGAMSDGMSAIAGTASLGYALAIIQIVGLWGAAHFWLAARSTHIAPVGIA